MTVGIKQDIEEYLKKDEVLTISKKDRKKEDNDNEEDKIKQEELRKKQLQERLQANNQDKDEGPIFINEDENSNNDDGQLK